MQAPRPHHLLFIGATARWAAQSATRAGIRASAIDMFGDSDLLREVDRWQRLEQWSEVANLVPSFNCDAAVFLGGVEARTETIDEVAALLPVVGPSSEIVSKLRAPELLDELVQGTLVRRPQRLEKLDANELAEPSWLWKQKGSCGGLGVCYARSGVLIASPKNGYYERQMPGRVFGFSFLATNDGVRFLGAAANLRSGRSPRPFLYEGCIGPITLADKFVEAASQVAVRMANATPLRGLFGLDLIIGPDHSMWLLECNPRATSSMELLENDTSLISLHNVACGGGRLPTLSSSSSLRGKRVLYRRPNTRPPAGIDRTETDSVLPCSDLPSNIDSVSVGAPLCTLNATGNRAVDVSRKLAAEAHACE